MSGFCFRCCDDTHLNEKEYQIATQFIPHNIQHNVPTSNQQQIVYNQINPGVVQTQPIVQQFQEPNQNNHFPNLQPKLSSSQKPDIHATTSVLMGSMHKNTIQDSIIHGKFDNLMYDVYPSIKKQPEISENPARPEQPITPIENMKPIINPIQPTTTFTPQQQYQQPRYISQGIHQVQPVVSTPQYFPRSNNIYPQPVRRF